MLGTENDRRRASFSNCSSDGNTLQRGAVEMATGSVYSLPVTINYEDTDAAGVVYYANYLAYMERARNACLRAAGLPLTVVRDEHNAVFVVTEVRLRYRKPAMLDDVISVTLEVDELRGASVTFIHHVLRGEELLVDGQVRLGILSGDTCVPCRIPDVVRQVLNRHRIQ